MNVMTTNIAEKLTQDIQKSVNENVQGAFDDSLKTMRGQIEENRSALKDLGKRLSDVQQLQQLLERIDKAYTDIEQAIDKAQSTADELQEQQSQQRQGQQSQGSRKKS